MFVAVVVGEAGERFGLQVEGRSSVSSLGPRTPRATCAPASRSGEGPVPVGRIGDLSMSALLDQFLSEARDLLDDAGKRLLAIERGDAGSDDLHALFRAIHSVKGGSGLFPFGALTRAVHAAEDLLDAARRGDLLLGPEIVDDLLETVDRVGIWLDGVDDEGLPPGVDAESAELAGRLRAHLDKTGEDGREAEAHAKSAPPPPLPLDELHEDLEVVARAAIGRGERILHVRYRPAPECFFQGDDPLTIIGGVPSPLVGRLVSPDDGFGPLEAFDPFVCSIGFELLSSAPRADVEAALKFVAPDVVIRDVGGTSPAHEPKDLAAGALDATEERAAVAATEERAAVAATEERAGRAATARAVLKIEQEKIDLLMDLVGELVVAKNGLAYLARRAEQHPEGGPLSRAILEHHGVLHRIAAALQGTVMQVRMLPISHAFDRFPRLVRDLGKKLGKRVAIEIEGGATEVDKAVIDRLADPLTHLVRNSLDHGIELPEARVEAGKSEEATVTLRASRDGDRLRVEVRDDGRGIDVERLKRKVLERGLLDDAKVASLSDTEARELIFLPGLSTAEAVSDVSGRGVGMDAVRRTIQSLGGEVFVDSTVGEGTRIELAVPITMTITRVLIVDVGGEHYGAPLESVLGVLRVPASSLASYRGQHVVQYRERLVPVLELAEVLGGRGARASKIGDDGEVAILLLEVATRTGSRWLGVAVDAFDANVDVVLKPLDGILAGLRIFSGSAILGDGRAVLVLNPKELVAWRSGPMAAASC
jgi:two-component system chemotaxis sensor kinase CheA